MSPGRSHNTRATTPSDSTGGVVASCARMCVRKVRLSAAGLLQDVLIRMKDSVVGALKPDFFEKTTDNADL